MSKIGKILGKEKDEQREDVFTEEQENFLKEEEFKWNEYTGWNYEGSENDYNIWIQAKVNRFTLYIYQGEYEGKSEIEEDFYWLSQEEFERQYDNLLEEIKNFFEEKKE